MFKELKTNVYLVWKSVNGELQTMFHLNTYLFMCMFFNKTNILTVAQN